MQSLVHSQPFLVDVMWSVSLCSPGSFCLQSSAVTGVCHHAQFSSAVYAITSSHAAPMLLCYSEAHSCAQNRGVSNKLTLRQTLVVSPSKGAKELKVHLTRYPCLASIIQMNCEACPEHVVSGCSGGQGGFR